MSPGRWRGAWSEELLVDAEDDLQVARQHMLHQRHRPGLQRLGHQRVVGVAERCACTSPRRRSQGMPCSSHSSRISSATPMAGWVSLRWIATLSARLSSVPCSRRWRARMSWIDALADEEVLLAQPQLAAGRRAVVRVQHPGDVLVLVLELGGARVVAGVEGVQVDVRRRHRLPQPQRADLVGAVAGDHHVVGLGRHLAAWRQTGWPGRLRARPSRRSAPGRRCRQRGNSQGVPSSSQGRGARPGGRPGSPARTCRIRSGCRSRRRAGPAWPSNRGSRPPAGPGRRCPAPRRARNRPGPPACGHGAPPPAGGVGQVQRGQRVAQRAADQELHRQVVDAARLGIARSAACVPPSAATAARAPPAPRACIRSVRVGAAASTATVCSRWRSTASGQAAGAWRRALGHGASFGAESAARRAMPVRFWHAVTAAGQPSRPGGH
jgi:hypothetical protein